MILDRNTKLEAVLDGAVSANQPEFHVDYVDWTNANVATVPAQVRGALNSANDVTLLAAPAGIIIRSEINRVSIYNKDTATRTVTVKTDDGTERVILKATLLTLEALHYGNGKWYAITANGGIKQGGVSIPGSSTDNAVVRWDGATGTAIQNSAFIVDDSGHVTSFGGNITFPGTQSASAGANTLDDYEEGTWTPAVGGNATYTAQAGTYTKVGRFVHVQYDLTINVIGTGSASTISGLPFSAATYAALSTAFFFTLTKNVYDVNTVVNSGTATMIFYTLTAAAASSTGADTILGNSTQIAGGGGYQV